MVISSESLDNCWVNLLETKINFYSLNFGPNNCIDLGGKLSKYSQDLIEKVNSKDITFNQAIESLDQIICSLIKEGFPVLKYIPEQSVDQCLLSVESNPETYVYVKLVDSLNPEDCVKKLQSKVKLINMI